MKNALKKLVSFYIHGIVMCYEHMAIYLAMVACMIAGSLALTSHQYGGLTWSVVNPLSGMYWFCWSISALMFFVALMVVGAVSHSHKDAAQLVK